MKNPLIAILLMLAAACAVGAQEGNFVGSPAKGTAEMSATQSELINGSGIATESRDFAFAISTPTVADTGAAESPAAPTPSPAAKPRFVFGDRDDYRWQLGVGLEFLRFQSSRINSSLLGLNTTVSYYTNDWFALEGNLVTGFGSTIFQQEHVKYLGGGGGFRVGTRRARWEPWGHGLIGASHLQPQTANASKMALMAQAGIGVDYRVNARFSLRGEGDWVYNNYFNSNQNSFQAVASVVFHF
jgi:hypothetical protein